MSENFKNLLTLKNSLTFIIGLIIGYVIYSVFMVENFARGGGRGGKRGGKRGKKAPAPVIVPTPVIVPPAGGMAPPAGSMPPAGSVPSAGSVPPAGGMAPPTGAPSSVTATKKNEEEEGDEEENVDVYPDPEYPNFDMWGVNSNYDVVKAVLKKNNTCSWDYVRALDANGKANLYAEPNKMTKVYKNNNAIWGLSREAGSQDQGTNGGAVAYRMYRCANTPSTLDPSTSKTIKGSPCTGKWEAVSPTNMWGMPQYATDLILDDNKNLVWKFTDKQHSCPYPCLAKDGVWAQK